MNTPKEVQEMVLHAWVGEDELGSGEFGIKQGIVPAGHDSACSLRDWKAGSVLHSESNEGHGRRVRQNPLPVPVHLSGCGSQD